MEWHRWKIATNDGWEKSTTKRWALGKLPGFTWHCRSSVGPRTNWRLLLISLHLLWIITISCTHMLQSHQRCTSCMVHMARFTLRWDFFPGERLAGDIIVSVLTFRFGPLQQHWMMRCEAKHSLRSWPSALGISLIFPTLSLFDMRTSAIID